MNAKQTILTLILVIPFLGNAQEITPYLFTRVPHVVNYNFTQESISYSPIQSIGVGILHKAKFIELAPFITDDDIYGFYSFFGVTLKSKELGENINLYTNWFGDVNYIPNQGIEAVTYTSGICVFPNFGFKWGSVGVPICIGLAYGQKTLSLNSRTILNLSFYIN